MIYFLLTIELNRSITDICSDSAEINYFVENKTKFVKPRAKREISRKIN